MKKFNKSLFILLVFELSGCTSQISNTPETSETLSVICMYASDPYPYGAIHSYNLGDRAIVQRCTIKDGEPYWDTVATL